MSIFQIILLSIIALFLTAVCIIVYKKKGITFHYNKTVTTINKLDDLQLEIAKQNLEELKKYNENASKHSVETSKAISTMTTAVQELMGVNDETNS
jgi:muramoyltetrapeptide carboxypeptidase LdcA involved in peptidoglycan recycling